MNRASCQESRLLPCNTTVSWWRVRSLHEGDTWRHLTDFWTGIFCGRASHGDSQKYFQLVTERDRGHRWRMRAFSGVKQGASWDAPLDLTPRLVTPVWALCKLIDIRFVTEIERHFRLKIAISSQVDCRIKPVQILVTWSPDSTWFDHDTFLYRASSLVSLYGRF